MAVFEEVIVSVVADSIFWLLVGFVSWIAIKASQKKFLSFFGLENGKPIHIYLSNLWVASQEKPIGYLISGHEFKVTESINGLFGSLPFRLPEIVRGIVDNFWVGNKLKKKYFVSPQKMEGFHFSNMIIIGGQVRNIVRQYYVTKNSPYLIFEQDPNNHREGLPHVLIAKGRQKGKRIGEDYNVAIIEKLHDEEHGTTVFMCAGHRADSSWVAAEYLARNWRHLKKRYGDKEFAICLGFPKLKEFMDEYIEPVVLEQLP